MTDRFTDRFKAQWFKDGASGFSGQLLFGEELSKYTYYRIGGAASVLATPKTIADVEWLAQGIQQTGISFFILGNGSNLLVADSGYEGLVISAARLNLEIKELTRGDDKEDDASSKEKLRIRTGASVAVSTLLRRASQAGWSGFEFLTGIPGTMGGVVTMNGGTHLGEVESHVRRVEAFSLVPEVSAGSFLLTVFEKHQLQFQYRRNNFLPKGGLIYAAEWEVTPEDPKRVKEAIDRVLARRKSTQPLDYPSCGSVFKNPKEAGLSAWQVIDRLGLRGHRIGGAEFAQRHSNFILNLDRAKAADVRALIELAKTRALAELGIVLEEEVIYLGFPSQTTD